MKSGGIVRPIDKMGRVVIPKEIRAQLNIRDEVDSVEISVQGEEIILRKHYDSCVFCDSMEESINYKGYIVCRECIEKLESSKDKAD